MRKINKILILVVIACLLFAVTGCNKDKVKKTATITLVSVTYDADVYQGEDIDLSKGTLKYKSGSSNKEIALNGSGVSVTGYDKDTAGEQTLTVTYSKKSITFTVDVLSKISVDGVKTTYSKDDEFDYATGSVKVRKSDGTYDTVALDDARITVVGFDSSKAQKSEVTVKFTENGKTYETSYEISVNSVKFKTPNTVSYKNFDEALNLSGGYFEVTVDGNTTYVQLSSSRVTVTGYDPTVVNVDNPKVTQKITVTFEGKEYYYNVEVKYSYVSWIKDVSADLATLDWNGKTAPKLSETQGEDAITAYQKYKEIDPKERESITYDEYLRVIRATVITAYDKWMAEAKTFENTFTVGATSIGLGCKEYETTKADYERLIDKDALIHYYSGILYDIIDTYSDEFVYGETKIIDHIGALYTDTVYERINPLLEMMITVYETLSPDVVSNDWEKDDLYADEIAAAIEFATEKMLNSGFTGLNNAFVFDLISNWRPNDDLMDIVYSYYLYGSEENKEFLKKSLFQKLPLPTNMQTLYSHIANAYSIASDYNNNPQQTVWAETIGINYYYNEIQDTVKVIEESGYQLEIDLYDFLNMDYFILYNVTYTPYGVEQQAKEMYADPIFDGVWSQLSDLYEVYMEGINEGVNLESDAEKIDALVKSFADMSPSWQYSFIASMLNGYRTFDTHNITDLGWVLALDFDTDLDGQGEKWTFFTMLCDVYYDYVLSYANGDQRTNYTNAQAITSDLFRAIEYYATRYKYTESYDKFLSTMKDVVTDYGKLAGNEKQAFDTSSIKYVYDKYSSLYSQCISSQTVNYGQLESVRAELESLIRTFIGFNDILEDTTKTSEEKAAIRPIFFATYEYIVTLAKQITDSNSQEILYDYYNAQYSFSDNLACSLEHGVWFARSEFMYEIVNIIQIPITQNGTTNYYPAWELYDGVGTAELLAKTYYVMNTQYVGGEFDAEKVVEIMSYFRQTKVYTRDRFIVLDCDELYYAGLTAFFAGYSEDISTLAEKLIAVEKAYFFYDGNATENNTTAFVNAMNEAISAQEDVTATEDYDDLLKEMFEFYKAKYDAITETQE